MCESVLFFHRIWIDSGSAVIDFEVYKVEKALLHQHCIMWNQKGRKETEKEGGGGEGREGLQAQMEVWQLS